MVARITMIKRTTQNPGHPGLNNSYSKSTAESIVFAKRKPTFKIRIDSLKQRASSPATTNRPTSQQQKQKQKRIKRVRIAEHRNTVLFRHVPESELKQSCWYQSKDYADFKQQSRQTLDALQQADGNLSLLNANEHCIRGLEAHVSRDVLQLRQMRIRSTVQVVLDQQQVQRLHGIKDPLLLGAVSMMFSKQSRQTALSMGALDNALRGC